MYCINEINDPLKEASNNETKTAETCFVYNNCFIIVALLFIYIFGNKIQLDLPLIGAGMMGFSKHHEYIHLKNISIKKTYKDLFFSYKELQPNTSYETCAHYLSFPPSSTFMTRKVTELITLTANMSSRLSYFFEARGIYVHNFGILICNNTMYPNRIDNNFRQYYNLCDGQVERHLHIAIFFSNRYQKKKFYGHWVVDFILPLLKIPKPIRDSVPIIVSHDILPSILQMLDVIGIQRDQII